MKEQFKTFKLKSFNNRGYLLTPMEIKDTISFKPKRVYFLDMPKETYTGEHCHKVEEELFVLMKGSVVAVIDKGEGKEEVKLTPGDAMYVPAYVWHGFKDPGENCMLLAISSTNYTEDRKDYIEDYEEFLEIRQK